jgi:hypothetical protein
MNLAFYGAVLSDYALYFSGANISCSVEISWLNGFSQFRDC